MMLPDPVIVHALLAVAAVAVVLRLVYVQRRRIESGPYDDLLGAEMQAWFDGLRAGVTDALAEAGDTRPAYELWGRDLARAQRALASACDRLERVAAPELRDVLRELRRLAATLEVWPPARPLAGAARRLARGGGFGSMLDLARWLVVTGWERARVRLWLLRRSAALVFRAWTGTALLVPRHGFGQDWYASPRAALGPIEAHGAATAEAILEAFGRWRAARA